MCNFHLINQQLRPSMTRIIYNIIPSQWSLFEINQIETELILIYSQTISINKRINMKQNRAKILYYSRKKIPFIIIKRKCMSLRGEPFFFQHQTWDCNRKKKECVVIFLCWKYAWQLVSCSVSLIEVKFDSLDVYQ
jgi:hypothetical protein